MNNSKNFNLYLMDGDVTGRIKCTLANWTGIAYKIPRSYLDKCEDRQDLRQSGVYFLFGKNDKGEDDVYIGQAGGEGILFRVAEDLKDEVYFRDVSDVVIFITQNNSFGLAEVNYLESRFIHMAMDVGRFNVRYGINLDPGNVTEEKESELDDFIEYSKMVLGVLGYKLFILLVKESVEEIVEENEEEIVDEEKNEENKDLTLYLSRKIKRSGRTIEAKCIKTDKGFKVLKGSMIEEIDSKSIPKTIKVIRRKCRIRNKIVDGRLVEDHLFTSPSSAAEFVLGMNTKNGRTDWKTKDGLTLKELEEKGSI